MLKAISLLVSFLIGQFRGHQVTPLSYETIIKSLVSQLRGLLSSLAFGLSGIIIAIAGFLMAYFNLLSQFDLNGSISIGAVALGGLVLVIAGIGLLYSAGSKNIPVRVQAREELRTSTVSPLEAALSSLILDYIKEREIKREAKVAEFTTQPPSPPISAL